MKIKQYFFIAFFSISPLLLNGQGRLEGKIIDGTAQNETGLPGATLSGQEQQPEHQQMLQVISALNG